MVCINSIERVEHKMLYGILLLLFFIIYIPGWIFRAWHWWMSEWKPFAMKANRGSHSLREFNSLPDSTNWSATSQWFLILHQALSDLDQLAIWKINLRYAQPEVTDTDMLGMVQKMAIPVCPIIPLNFNLGSLWNYYKKTKGTISSEKKQLSYIHPVLFLRIFPLLHKPPKWILERLQARGQRVLKSVDMIMTSHCYREKMSYGFKLFLNLD